MIPWRALAGISLLWLLVGCAPQRSVRVDPVPGANRKPAAEPVRPGEYRVVSGDTLYGIAFRHGLDYRALAAANGIAAPYTIYPGQRLRVDARAAAPSGKRPATGARTAPSSANSRSPAVVAPILKPAAADSAPPTTPRPSAEVSPAAAQPAAPPATTAPKPAVISQEPSAAPAVASLPARVAGWQWPAEGRLIGTFLAGDPTRQGINIAGSSGDPVLAAAAGVVVYSGAGLIGYGELIIVKHDDTWLSAYGHNRKRLVAEGESVKVGQRIAEMGRSGASRDMLHFEVRKRGRSVDPLSVLPKR